MKKLIDRYSSSIILLLLVCTFILHLNPFSFWMPDMAQMFIASAFCITVATYTALFWREQPEDERAGAHMHIADRHAFITANIVLITGMIAHMVMHTSDTWLFITVFVMNITKIISRHLLERYH